MMMRFAAADDDDDEEERAPLAAAAAGDRRGGGDDGGGGDDSILLSGDGRGNANMIVASRRRGGAAEYHHPRGGGRGGLEGGSEEEEDRRRRSSPTWGRSWPVTTMRGLIFASVAVVGVTLSVSWLLSPSSTGGIGHSDPSAASNWLLRLRYAITSSRKEGNGGDNNHNNDNELIANPRPPLHELIADFHTNVTGNVSWLMDFALLGHSKCATTSHLQWLRSHPQILAHEREVHALTRGRSAEMVSLLYALPNRPHRIRGYKAPNDISSRYALEQLRLHWPTTKFVLGVRHPVRWFESFYNFNRRQHDNGRPDALDLGPADTLGVPSRAYFHRNLALLGKTNVSDPGERALLGPSSFVQQPPLMGNKVFLYESSQPYEFHNGRGTRYRYDLQQFLGLSSPLDPIPLHGESDGKSYNYTSDNYHYEIDICDDKYESLRIELLDVGAAAAGWILTYFVKHPDVTVSSPRRFEELLKRWSVDPCEK